MLTETSKLDASWQLFINSLGPGQPCALDWTHTAQQYRQLPQQQLQDK